MLRVIRKHGNCLANAGPEVLVRKYVDRGVVRMTVVSVRNGKLVACSKPIERLW